MTENNGGWFDNIAPWRRLAPDSGELDLKIASRTAHRPGVTSEGLVSVENPIAPGAEISVPGREVIPHKK